MRTTKFILNLLGHSDPLFSYFLIIEFCVLCPTLVKCTKQTSLVLSYSLYTKYQATRALIEMDVSTIIQLIRPPLISHSHLAANIKCPSTSLNSSQKFREFGVELDGADCTCIHYKRFQTSQIRVQDFDVLIQQKYKSRQHGKINQTNAINVIVPSYLHLH